ncbi:2OG-Fe(II) oxygenase [Myxococcus stipitatus]|uniref:2OG-Fe(II) oxygenase n=1 Tax=Myxococcus stipitatus TaxID=83455 RepID=UPI0030D39291
MNRSGTEFEDRIGAAVIRRLTTGVRPSPAPRPPHRSSSRAHYVLIDELLVAEELAGLRQYTLDRQNLFAETRVMHAESGQGELDYSRRRSRVLFEFEPWQSLLTRRVLAAVPFVLARLGRESFPVSRVEAQLTASNDGEFFRPHNDNTHERVRRREITFVYYFFTEPKPFNGGELRLYDGPPLPSGQTPPSFVSITPRQNQVVFFPSNTMHEVRTTYVPSRSFAHSRFTVNGWVHK